MNIAIVSDNIEKATILGRIIALFFNGADTNEMIEEGNNKALDTIDYYALIPSNFLEREIIYALTGNEVNTMKAFLRGNISEYNVEYTFNNKIKIALYNTFSIEEIVEGTISSFHGYDLIICGIKDQTTIEAYRNKGFIIIGLFSKEDDSLFGVEETINSDMYDTAIFLENEEMKEIVESVINNELIIKYKQSYV